MASVSVAMEVDEGALSDNARESPILGDGSNSTLSAETNTQNNLPKMSDERTSEVGDETEVSLTGER